jgi:prepilin-type N-terminal cleavage/methylation domain-containing protein
MSRRRCAFTLVELLVVVGILALLLSILMPTLGQVRELARKTMCQTNLANLGKGWIVYFHDNDNKTPQTHNVNTGTPDCIAQFDYMIYCGHEHTTGRPDYVNAGVLYREELVAGHQAYACPTIERNYSSDPWFTKGYAHLGRNHPVNRNPWPALKQFGSYMTYGKRRMNYYDEPGLSYFPWNHPRPRPNEHIMLWSASISIVENPTGFSWMADKFTTGGWAMLSHVPGLNVLFLDARTAPARCCTTTASTAGAPRTTGSTTTCG